MLNFSSLNFTLLLEAGNALAETETESLLNNEYTQELKQSAWHAWSTIFSTRFFYALVLIAIMFVLFKVVDLVVRPLRQRYSSPFLSFLAAAAKAVIGVVIVLRIMNLFTLLSGLTEQILMSSSLLVVVAGFVFQEGLTNIVHGFILSVSKPFQIGDRVTVTIDGNVLTGYVRTMGLRSTAIQNVENNAFVSVPNAKMDLGLIQNNYTDPGKSSSGFMDLSVTYESDLERAVSLVQECIARNPMVTAERIRTGETDPPFVLVRSFGDSGIDLRGIVKTRTVEENFSACSDIRRAIKAAVDADPDVEFAYPHMQIVETESRKTPDTGRKDAGRKDTGMKDTGGKDTGRKDTGRRHPEDENDRKRETELNEADHHPARSP